jgi:hypothetical protein
MKVTRERKIYAAVIGLALLGLTLDRTIYGSQDATVTSSTVTDSSGTVPATAPSGNSPAGSGAEELSLAARLSNAAQEFDLDGNRASPVPAAGMRDPFSHNVIWLTPAQVDTACSGTVDQFVQRHTLSAVMDDRDGTKGYAIIDGQCVRIGKSIDGFRLVSVDRSSATLESGSARVKLGLPSVPARSSGS